MLTLFPRPGYAEPELLLYRAGAQAYFPEISVSARDAITRRHQEALWSLPPPAPPSTSRTFLPICSTVKGLASVGPNEAS